MREFAGSRCVFLGEVLAEGITKFSASGVMRLTRLWVGISVYRNLGAHSRRPIKSASRSNTGALGTPSVRMELVTVTGSAESAPMLDGP